jgi:hypothetical protein
MFTRKTAAIAAAVLALSIPAGAALAADDEVVEEAPVATCDQEQTQSRLRLQIHDPAEAGEQQATMLQTRQQLRIDPQCDGDGPQEGYGPGGQQFGGGQSGTGAAVRSQAKAGDGTCDGTGQAGGGGRNFGGGA